MPNCIRYTQFASDKQLFPIGFLPWTVWHLGAWFVRPIFQDEKLEGIQDEGHDEFAVRPFASDKHLRIHEGNLPLN